MWTPGEHVASNLITKRAAAERAACSVKTIHRLIADGTLVAYRVGARGVRIDPDELDATLRERPHGLHADRDKLSAYIAGVVATAPPLTPEQRDRIANLLRAGGDPPGPRTSLDPLDPGTAEARGTGSTLRPTATPPPEPDDGGRTSYKDPTANAAVRNLTRGGRG